MKLVLSIFSLLFFSVVAFGQAAEYDTSFSENGIATISNGIFDAKGHALAIQTDGKIVIGGRVHLDFGLQWGFGVARFKSDGTVDSSFGINGMVVLEVGDQSYATLTSIAIQQDGKIIGAGWAEDSVTQRDFALVRYKTDGSLDSTFGSDGIVLTDSDKRNNEINGIALQADGKIIVAGENYSDNWNRFALARYNSDGTLDPSFGDNGIVAFKAGSSHCGANALVVDTNGKIIVAGWTQADSLGYAIVKLNADGTHDLSFGADGLVTTFITDYSIPYCVVLQNDKIIVGGWNIIRYNSDGEIDSQFGSFGVAYNPGFVYGICIENDGKILITGSMNPEKIFTSRYFSNGLIDQSFGPNGTIALEYLGDWIYSYAIIQQPDEKIVVGGYYYNTFVNTYFIVIRYITELALGVQEFSSGISPFIYPNPVHQFEQIKYTLTRDEMLTLSLTDANGTEIKNFFAYQKRVAGNHIEQINMGELAAGNYFLVLDNGKQKVTVKLVKQ